MTKFHYGFMHLPEQNASIKIGPLICKGARVVNFSYFSFLAQMSPIMPILSKIYGF